MMRMRVYGVCGGAFFEPDCITASAVSDVAWHSRLLLSHFRRTLPCR